MGLLDCPRFWLGRGIAALFSALFALQVSAQSAAADEVSCTRYKLDSAGFTSRKAADSWYPENLVFEVDGGSVHWKVRDPHGKLRTARTGKLMYRKGDGRLEARFAGKETNERYSSPTLAFLLLPSGKATLKIRKESGKADAGTARYRCRDKTILAALEKRLQAYLFSNDKEMLWVDRATNTLTLSGNSTRMRHLMEDTAKHGQLTISVRTFLSEPDLGRLRQDRKNARLVEGHVVQSGGTSYLKIPFDGIPAEVATRQWLVMDLRPKGGFAYPAGFSKDKWALTEERVEAIRALQRRP